MIRIFSNRLLRLPRQGRVCNVRRCNSQKLPENSTPPGPPISPQPAAPSAPQSAPMPQPAPVSTSASTPVAAAPAASGWKNFEFKKYTRPFFMVMGMGILMYNVVLNGDNPQSFVNRTLYPRGKNKYILKVQRLDDQISQYRAAYVHTSSGLQEALRHRTRELKSREYGINLDLLTPEQVEKLQYIAQKYAALRKAMDSILEAGQKVQKMELNDLIQMELDAVKKIEESYEQQDPKAEEIKDELLTKAGEKEVQLSGLLESSLAQRIRLELSLVIALNILLKEEPKTAKLLNANPSLIGKMKNRILGLHEDVPDLILEQLKSTAFVPIRLQPRVFVLNFVGDMMASQVHTFREEVTALLSIADPTRDEVVIRLNSSGGTVTGYGLAAAQISRMREKGFKVNVAIDEVAASGGYMMAAVADKIYCSPFAVVGSIGVIMTVPNIAERLTREGVVIEDVTAGKYKRTMTPYKKPTYEDRTKVKEEVENILVLFKSFLKENRPGLDIDKLATGEVWHGSQALKLGLVDEIKTYDDLLLSYVDEHKEVYMLTVKPVMSRFGDDDMPLMQGVMAYVGQWLQSAVAAAVRGALFGSNHTLGEAPAPYMALEDHYAPTLAMDPVYQHPSSSPRM